MRRTVVVVILLLFGVIACTDSTSVDTTAPTQSSIALSPSTTTTPAATASVDPLAGPVSAPVRHPATARSVYFVMADRFENGDTSNDTGGLDSDDPLETGFLASDRAYHHGGDLAGLLNRLDYLEGLGIGAIWITPPFTNRWVQGDGTIENSSSSYHGYWNIDWSRVDPHLGSDADMVALIEQAHARDIHVYFDIVVNHTGDVIIYEDGTTSYIGTGAKPYLDADGNPFDPAEMTTTGQAPELDPAVSFPRVPTFADPTDATIKSPDWLNDLTLYHNRGDSTFAGESDTFGDFFGLDDLFTEHPAVVAGMSELHADLIRRFPIDGFRVDTAKHVNPEFWETFIPSITEAAAQVGRSDFFVFGEVFTEDPIVTSAYSTQLGFSSTLDFIFNGAVTRYVAEGLGATAVADAFDNDDWFTDDDSNASMQVKFFGNHDIGRMGTAIRTANPGAGDDELLARMRLGFDMLFLTRGVPVVYYGDEQGFTGEGGDQLARQDMFPTQVAEYADDEQIGTDATPADDNFDSGHPLYEWIGRLTDLRSQHPALVSGAQIPRKALAGAFAVSRIDRDERIEYLVLTNNGDGTTPATFTTFTPGAEFTAIHPAGANVSVTATGDGTVSVDIPPLSSMVLISDRPAPLPDTPPEITLVRPDPGAQLPTFRYRLEAELADTRYAEVTFSVSIDDGDPIVVGTDDASPYRVYWDNSAFPDGSAVTVIATVDDGSGNLAGDRRDISLGARR